MLEPAAIARAVLAGNLAGEGWDVEIAGDVTTFLFQAFSGSWAAVLVDVTPEGLTSTSGAWLETEVRQEVLATLHALREDGVACILMSGGLGSQIPAELRNAAHAVLEKPFAMREMLLLLKAHRLPRA